jgi:hypothetical protein
MICSLEFVDIITFYVIWKNLLQKYMYSQFLRIFATVCEISHVHESTGRMLYERYFG